MSKLPEDPAPSRRGSWWTTLPGMLTAAAGLITAITAMVVALNGVFRDSGEQQSAPPVTPALAEGVGASDATTPETAPASKPEQGAAYVVTYPGGTRVTIRDLVYKVRRATVKPRNPGELTLAVPVQLTVNQAYDAYFGTSDFRLRVGETNRAPVNFFSEVALHDTSMEKTVEFAIPDRPGTAMLILGPTQDEKVELPIKLQRR